MTSAGIHHVTAISGAAPRTLAFYTGTLGLRLVKKTVNFDDPGTWHFYFGDAAGSPGSILTVFPWAGARQGRLGVGETQETMLRVPQASLGFWAQRLLEAGVDHDTPTSRFGESRIDLRDPDGMRLSLVAVAGAGAEPAREADGIPADHAIRGVHGVTLLLADADPTARILTGVLGFVRTETDGALTRFVAGGDGIGRIVDIRAVGGFPRGALGRGTVHHVAFRAADDAGQAAMVEALGALGIAATEQKDRAYFRSVYFREPGGVLFEIATDGPGFAVDEAADALGTTLRLPAFLEPHRARIEQALPETA
jgi:glyoxalase family protein